MDETIEAYERMEMPLTAVTDFTGTSTSHHRLRGGSHRAKHPWIAIYSCSIGRESVGSVDT